MGIILWQMHRKLMLFTLVQMPLSHYCYCCVICISAQSSPVYISSSLIIKQLYYEM